MAITDWSMALAAAADALAKRGTPRREYLDANIASVEQLLRGIGPDDTEPTDGAGACIVVNIAAKHVPGFCNLSANGDTHPYKNAYQLGRVTARREAVDDAVVEACRLHGVRIRKTEICFAALETNGTGIRFFGDMCLVLRERPPWLPEGQAPHQGGDFPLRELRVLERNSYDVSRAPVNTQVERAEVNGASFDDARAEHLCAWLGSWESDLIDMLATRIVQELPAAERRWTSGQIARAVLDDEDYCEVLYPESFAAKDLAEVRTSAADVAAEADITNRERSGEGAAAHELLWRDQRRDARRALQRAGIPVRVVTSHARRRGS